MKKTLLALPLLVFISAGNASAESMTSTVKGSIAVNAPVKFEAYVSSGILGVNDEHGSPTWESQPYLYVQNNSVVPVALSFKGSGNSWDSGIIRAYDSTSTNYIALTPDSAQVNASSGSWDVKEKLKAGGTVSINFNTTNTKIEPGQYSYTLSVTARNV